MTGTSSRHAGSWSSGPGSRRRRRGGTGRGGAGRAGVEAIVEGAMREASPIAVTASVSGGRLPDRGGLLLGEVGVGAARGDGLRVDARAGARVQAREDPAVALRVEQGQGEALVAAGLLERVVADQADPLERPQLRRLEDRRPRRRRRRAPCRPRRPSRGGRRGRPRGCGPPSPGSAPPAGPRGDSSAGGGSTTTIASTTTATIRATTMIPMFGVTSALRSIEGSSEGGPGV